MSIPIVYVPNNSLDVYYNFGLESLFVQQKKWRDKRVFLLWRTEPALMLGRYQDALSEINTAYAKEKNIHIVRRMSGGGTIYTDPGSFQYSFIQAQDGSEIEFAQFIEPVIKALRELGIPAEFNGRNDLVVAGKKFSGCAQYKQDGFVVHHGSILFDTNIEQMVASTTVQDYKLISKGIRSVRERVVNLRDCLPPEHKNMSTEAFGDTLAAYLASGGRTSEKVQIYELSAADKAEAQRLGESKYHSAEAIWGKNPEFSLELSGHFPGGHVKLLLSVIHGKISRADLQGDFFAALKDGELQETLQGVDFKREAVLTALEQASFGDKIYHLSPQELASLIPI